jgi:hypothetical protein
MGFLRRCIAVSLLIAPFSLQAQARFDLIGPKIDIRVTRGGVALPISKVPNLQPGDQIWLHPDLPPTQSVHYLLIATFLRGTTNPPPDEWFTRIETWSKKSREEGVTVTVPADAQQAVLFLAPETGGDYGTLRSAVKGRPGIFVRASQDLTEAGFEQARIEKYLASMKMVPPSDPGALLDHSNLLARTLNLRPNPECFKRPLDQQYNCLTQTGTQTLLDDGHSQTIVAALASGNSSDFINAASNTRLMAGGNYSAYVGALVDLARLMNGIHTAQYQYIPAIAFPDSAQSPESLNLRLNTAPSFHNPKSVIVIGLPPVTGAVLPPLRPAEPNHISCLLDPRMVLPINGAPLVFSTAYAHDMVLHLNLPEGTAANDIVLAANAFQGGLIVAEGATERHELPHGGTPAVKTSGSGAPKVTATTPTAQMIPGQPITGTISGMWGFDKFTGPTLPLQQVPGVGWRIVTTADTPANLIAGQPNHLQLLSTGTACIQSISLEPGDTKVDWKLDSPDVVPPADAKAQIAATGIPPVHPVDLMLNLQHTATPGSIRVAIQQFGMKEPDQLGTKTFSEPAKIESLHLHAGDQSATLSGTSLDQVKSLTFQNQGKGLSYVPPTPSEAGTDGAAPRVTMVLMPAKDSPGPDLKVSERVAALVHLQDGRTLDISTVVMPPRPSVSILSRRNTSQTTSAIQLSSPEDLPLGAQLVFFLKSKSVFPRTGQIELANADESLHTLLTVASGSLVLQDAHTILATFDPLKTFGPSTFGPFRLRAVAADGTLGEWLPLATIVRLPALTELSCPANVAASCLLSGSALYLIDSVSPDLGFANPTLVPEGFVDTSLAIPRPGGLSFFLRLRDDLTTTHQVSLPILPETPAK